MFYNMYWVFFRNFRTGWSMWADEKRLSVGISRKRASFRGYPQRTGTAKLWHLLAVRIRNAESPIRWWELKARIYVSLSFALSNKEWGASWVPSYSGKLGTIDTLLGYSRTLWECPWGRNDALYNLHSAIYFVNVFIQWETRSITQWFS